MISEIAQGSISLRVRKLISSSNHIESFRKWKDLYNNSITGTDDPETMLNRHMHANIESHTIIFISNQLKYVQRRDSLFPSLFFINGTL
jgi:NAD-dependent SIR2 family protein deacetylase